MLEAHIASPRGSFYYAGELSPYDLETLRQHLRDSVTEVPATDVHLELTLDDESVVTGIATWLRGIERSGVRVQCFFAHAPGARARMPARPVRRDDSAAPTVAATADSLAIA
jgi:hypothetical protein